MGRRMQQRHYFVYIMASRRNGTLYVGITNDILRRASERKSDAIAGFTKTYGVHMLVYWEAFDNASDAIAFEKRLKCGRREWKLALIEERNPRWRDSRLR